MLGLTNRMWSSLCMEAMHRGYKQFLTLHCVVQCNQRVLFLPSGKLLPALQNAYMPFSKHGKKRSLSQYCTGIAYYQLYSITLKKIYASYTNCP